jgi:hypothetical protein
MQSVYLYLNAALYLLFALWCTIAARSTAQNPGYLELNHSGRSEYLVVYGGLQWGLAAMFLMLASQPEQNRLGIRLSIALYAPIVLYRLFTVVRHRPVAPMTLAVAALEMSLLLGALWVYARGN